MKPESEVVLRAIYQKIDGMNLQDIKNILKKIILNIYILGTMNDGVFLSDAIKAQKSSICDYFSINKN
jgi:hypothetical protein